MTLTGRIARKALPKPAAEGLASFVNSYQRYRKLRHELSGFRQQVAACQTLDEQVEVVRNHQVFGAVQQQSEIMGLLKLLQQNPPRYLCEIGAASGGTLFLLTQVCQPDAVLISVDLAIPRERSLIHTRFASKNQQVLCFRGDSHAAETIDRVIAALRGNLLDFLFIDGDHTYDGVKADFENYRPLVRPGGVIAFHDIVPDFSTRYGKQTASYTGGVPVFWQELKGQYKSSELIEDHAQDGFGIGIIHM